MYKSLRLPGFLKPHWLGLLSAGRAGDSVCRSSLDCIGCKTSFEAYGRFHGPQL